MLTGYVLGRIVQEVRSALTVVCDGCFSRFRDELEEAKPRAVSKFVGVIMEVKRLQPATSLQQSAQNSSSVIQGAPLLYPNHGHVFLIEPSPALAYQISSEDTRMLIDIPESTQVSAKYVLSLSLY